MLIALRSLLVISLLGLAVLILNEAVGVLQNAPNDAGPVKAAILFVVTAGALISLLIGRVRLGSGLAVVVSLLVFGSVVFGGSGGGVWQANQASLIIASALSAVLGAVLLQLTTNERKADSEMASRLADTR